MGRLPAVPAEGSVDRAAVESEKIKPGRIDPESKPAFLLYAGPSGQPRDERVFHGPGGAEIDEGLVPQGLESLDTDVSFRLATSDGKRRSR